MIDLDYKNNRQTVFEAILARRSIRDYLPQEIERTTIHTLLEAAVRAPTAMHAEPWAFVVVQDRTVLKRLSDKAKPLFHEIAHPQEGLAMGCTENFNVFYNAGTLIIVCARLAGPFSAADCWLAAENLMLTACAIGLGSCVIGSSIPALNLPETKAELGILEEFSAVAPIIIGFPAGETAPTPRKKPNILYWK